MKTANVSSPGPRKRSIPRETRTVSPGACVPRRIAGREASASDAGPISSGSDRSRSAATAEDPKASRTQRPSERNVSVAETDHQDLWQRAALAIVAVSTTPTAASEALASVENELERAAPMMVTRTHVDFLT